MIEAVNSVLSSAQLVRGSVEQTASTRSFAVDPENSVSVPQAPYVSPYIVVDTDSNKAVLQIRDSDTGDVLRQFPSETRLEAQRLAQTLEAPRAPSIESSSTQQIDVPTASFDTTGVSTAPATGGENVALAQAASAALSSGAQSGVQSLSAGVSVFA